MLQKKTTHKVTLITLTKTAMVTALYIVLTISLSVISFGPLQLRLAEMFNYLSLYHKRYIFAVTLGVIVSNLASPLGFLDVIIGSCSTFCVLTTIRFAANKWHNMTHKMLLTAIICSFSMFTVAGQIHVVFRTPFFQTWAVLAVSEFFSMATGGVILYWISKKINLSKLLR